MFIEDPTTGQRAEVNSQRQLVTQAITESIVSWLTFKERDVWTFPFEGLDPTAADDLIVYLRNDDPDRHVVITRISLTGTVATDVEVRVVTGTAGGVTTTVTPTSRNLSQNVAPDVTALTSVDITGLTETATLEFITLEANIQNDKNISDHPIVLGRNNAIALLVEVATSIITGQITFYMRNRD